MAKPKPSMTPEMKENVVKWITDGLLTHGECAERLGVNVSTLIREFKRDPEFKKKVESANFAAHDALVTSMFFHAKTKDFRSAWTLLQRRWGKKWGAEATFTSEEMLKMALQFSELIKEFVPEDKQVGFAGKVEAIINDMESSKKKPFLERE